MSGLKVISKQSHDTIASAEQNSASIQMTTPSVVLVQEKLENVAEIKKDGLDLIVIMKDGQTIVLESYFAQGLMQHNLVFEEGPKELVWTQFTDPQNFVDGVVYENISSIKGMLDFQFAPPEASPWIYGLGVASLVAGGIVLLQEDSNNSTNVMTENRNLAATANTAPAPVVILESASIQQPETAMPEQMQDQAQPQSAANDNTEQAAAEAASADLIYNLLALTEQTDNAVNDSKPNSDASDLDWSALLSASSSLGDIALPDAVTAAASAEQPETADVSPTPEPSSFDSFVMQSVSLFDLLSTTWAA